MSAPSDPMWTFGRSNVRACVKNKDDSSPKYNCQALHVSKGGGFYSHRFRRNVQSKDKNSNISFFEKAPQFPPFASLSLKVRQMVPDTCDHSFVSGPERFFGSEIVSASQRPGIGKVQLFPAGDSILNLKKRESMLSKLEARIQLLTVGLRDDAEQNKLKDLDAPHEFSGCSSQLCAGAKESNNDEVKLVAAERGLRMHSTSAGKAGVHLPTPNPILVSSLSDNLAVALAHGLDEHQQEANVVDSLRHPPSDSQPRAASQQPTLRDLGESEARVWLSCMAQDAPERVAGQLTVVAVWMEKAGVTGEDLCSLSGEDLRQELPQLSLAARKWLLKAISASDQT